MTAATALRRSTLHAAGAGRLVKNIAAIDSGQTSGTTLVLTVPAGGVAAGNAVVIRSASDFTNNGPTAADSKSNTYQSIRTAPTGTNSFRATLLASVLTTALAAGDKITITYATAVTNRCAAADEFTGVKSPLSFSQGGASGTSTNPATSVVTTVPHTLVIGMVATATSVTTGFTQDPTFADLPRAGTSGTSPFISIAGGYQILGATNTARYRPTLPASTTWIALMGAFALT